MIVLDTFLSVFFLIVLCVPGYIVRKLKIINDEGIAALVNVLIYIAQPILTVSSFLHKQFEPEFLYNLAIVFVASFAVQLLILFIAKVAFMRCPRDGERRAAIVSSFMSNCSFVGIPLLAAMFPGRAEMIVYAAVFIVTFNILGWTLGVYTITGERKFISVKKALLNPPTVALIVALPLFFTSAVFFMPPNIADPMVRAVDYFGNMTTPLAMLIMGMRLADIPWKELFNSINVYIVSIIRLVISPIVTLGILLLVRLWIPVDIGLITAMYIIMALPTANSAVAFSEKFNGDRFMTVKCALVTALFCIVTIPALTLLLAWI